MLEVNVLAAFLAGVISFVSPCVLPIVPPTLAYISGVKLDRNNTSSSWYILACVIAFVAGFSTIFILFSLSIPLISGILTNYYVRIAAGLIIILMGLNFLGLFKIGIFYRELRVKFAGFSASPPGAFIAGLAFGFGWTPCIGPVLAVIYLQVAQADNVYWGIALLSAYSLGLGLPFIIAALVIDKFISFSDWLRRYMSLIEKIMGAILVIAGIMIMTDSISVISYWLLQLAPQFFSSIG